jgi:hypothetical protein
LRETALWNADVEGICLKSGYRLCESDAHVGDVRQLPKTLAHCPDEVNREGIPKAAVL